MVLANNTCGLANHGTGAIPLPTEPVIRGEPIERGIIAAGTRFETRWQRRTSEQPGPTVVVVAGIHGHSWAGPVAASEVESWPIQAGELIAIPAANPTALAVRKRRIPGLEGDAGDLNRHFPLVDGVVRPIGPAAPGLRTFLQSIAPDVVISLSEGFGVRAAGSTSVGSSIITRQRQDDEAQSTMLAAVNAGIDDPDHRFVPLPKIIERSLVRAAVDSLDLEGHALHTSTENQPVSLRCRQLRTRLADLGMVVAPRIDWCLRTPDVLPSHISTVAAS